MIEKEESKEDIALTKFAKKTGEDFFGRGIANP